MVVLSARATFVTLVSNSGMRKHIHYWLLLAVINVGLFTSMALQQHRYWRSTPTLAGSPYETFSCMMLARKPMAQAQREANWWFCCAECRPSLSFRLLAIANLGAVILVALLVGIATRLGATNQALIFYAVTPFAMVVWWFVVGWIVCHVRIRRQSLIGDGKTLPLL
jgi:hypothetical protein